MFSFVSFSMNLTFFHILLVSLCSLFHTYLIFLCAYFYIIWTQPIIFLVCKDQSKVFLPPASKGWGKVMFWHVSVLPQICLSTGGGVSPQSSWGGGQVQPGGSGPAGRDWGSGPAGGGQVQQGGSVLSPARGVRSSQGGGGVRSSWQGGGQVQQGGSGPGGGGVRSSRGGVRQVQLGGGSGPASGGGGSAKIGQQKEYSLHGGWYASCVHAGGLSCCIYYCTKNV